MPSRQAELLKLHREEILALAARHGILNVRVFGSVARGEERAESDIDLLVDYNEECDLFSLFDFWDGVEDLVGSKVDIASEDVLKRGREQVLSEACPL
jgi:predicted nucleotidyltransferase